MDPDSIERDAEGAIHLLCEELPNIDYWCWEPWKIGR